MKPCPVCNGKNVKQVSRREHVYLICRPKKRFYFTSKSLECSDCHCDISNDPPCRPDYLQAHKRLAVYAVQEATKIAKKNGWGDWSLKHHFGWPCPNPSNSQLRMAVAILHHKEFLVEFASQYLRIGGGRVRKKK